MFDGTYRFLESGELHHRYDWKEFDENTGEVIDSYSGKLNHGLYPITRDVMIIEGNLYYRLDR